MANLEVQSPYSNSSSSSTTAVLSGAPHRRPYAVRSVSLLHRHRLPTPVSIDSALPSNLCLFDTCPPLFRATNRYQPAYKLFLQSIDTTKPLVDCCATPPSLSIVLHCTNRYAGAFFLFCFIFGTLAFPFDQSIYHQKPLLLIFLLDTHPYRLFRTTIKSIS